MATTATEFETALIVSVSQIVDGEAKCHCGEDAVLVVTSEPDGDPGPTCFEHADEWLQLSFNLTRSIFGPKDA